MTDSDKSSVEVEHDRDESRFVARVDGVFAGASYYRNRGGRVVLLHTEVEAAFEGRGIGSALTKLALENARQQGEMVVPLCPFVESYIERHEEYADLLDEDMFRQLRS
jgi:predicted GNAT family acetyltransferase